jgi:hypothetical protein
VKITRRPGFWMLLQFVALVVVCAGAWNEPWWRYDLVVIGAFAYMYGERRYIRARAARVEASDA